MKKHWIICLSLAVLLLGGRLKSFGQDLDSLLEKSVRPTIDYATATFKATRIVNGHSVQQMKKNQLEFRISHRFGDFNSGGYNLWGLDYSTMHLSLEYGFTDWFEMGIGRSTYEKTVDGFAKFTLLRQSTGARNIPVHLSYLFSTEYIGSNIDTLMTNTASRLSFIQQVLIARKFNDQLSLQLTPTYIHRNLVPTELDKNDLFAMGLGGRYKLSNRIALNVEYYYVYRANAAQVNSVPGEVKYYNPLGIGIDIETGGHVFQIMISNSPGMREGGFIGKTTGSWANQGIHLGFNISRVFSFNKN